MNTTITSHTGSGVSSRNDLSIIHEGRFPNDTRSKSSSSNNNNNNNNNNASRNFINTAGNDNSLLNINVN
jgi:hypothetical protein